MGMLNDFSKLDAQSPESSFAQIAANELESDCEIEFSGYLAFVDSPWSVVTAAALFTIALIILITIL